MAVLQITGIVVFWTVLAAFGFRSLRQAVMSVRYREILEENLSLPSIERDITSKKGRCRLWFVGAGYESPNALVYFAVIEALFIFMGLGLVFIVNQSGWLLWVEEGLLSIPGNIGELFIPILYLAPFLVAIIMVAIPFVHIMAKRDRRAQRVEEELPIFLEYLVTLSEAGLGFDEALAVVLDTKKEKAVLGDVFRKFRKEVLAGTSRLDAYWRIRERLQVHSVRSFSSALIQAEQTGGSIAMILRQQAADALTRRRLKALEIAQTLPVQLIFPLMCCFLPGLLAVLLGPLLFRMFEAIDSITRTIRG